MKLRFVYAKDKLLEAFKIYSEFAKVKPDTNNFLKNWQDLPEKIIKNFLKVWRGKERKVLRAIADKYHLWESGEVEVWLFPNQKVLFSLPKPYSKITYTFRGLDKVYISLFFQNGKLPYWVLTHELFHANDLLRGILGASEKRHQLINKLSKRMEEEFFDEN